VKISPETFEVIQKAQEISELQRVDSISPSPLSLNSGGGRERKNSLSIEEVRGKLGLVNLRI